MELFRRLRQNQIWARAWLKQRRSALATLSIFILMTPMAEAASVDNVNGNGEVSVLRCAQSGGIEFELFIDSVIWNDNLRDSFEPIFDVTVRNQCHSFDVAGLVREQNKARDQIRNAFLTCNIENMAEMQKAYYKLTAEIYYVRNIVKGGVVASVVPFVQGTLGERLVTPKDELYQGLVDRYEDELTERELGELYLALEEKYRPRVQQYLDCTEGSFEIVAEEWKKFKEHFAGDFAGVREGVRGIRQEARELNEEISTIKTVEYFSGDKVSFADWVGSFVELQVNGVEPQRAVEEILAEIADNLPNFEISDMTHYEILNRVVYEEASFDSRKAEVEMRANFDLLYGSGSESSELFVHQLDGRYSPEVLGLLEVLDNSVGALSALDDGLNDINLRQCVQ